MSESLVGKIIKKAWSPPLSWATALLGAGVFTIFNGLRSPSPDQTQFFCFVLKVGNPGLFAHDLTFSGQEPQFTFAAHYFYYLSAFLSLEQVAILTQFANYVLLIYGMLRLGQVISGRTVSVWAILALLLLGMGNGFQVIGGHPLTSYFFYPQYTAYAAILLSFSYLLEARTLWASLWIGFSLLVYPLAGLYGLALMGSFLLVFPDKRSHITWSVGILAGSAVLGLLPSILTYGGSLSVRAADASIAIWKYLRSPNHFLPSYWWPNSYIHLGLAAGFAAIFGWLRDSLPADKKRGTVFFMAGIIALAMIATVNNQFLLSNLLFLANPTKISPVLIPIYFCAATAVLLNRAKRESFLAVLLVLCAPNPLVFLLLLLVFYLGDYYSFHLRLDCADTYSSGLRSRQVTLVHDSLLTVVALGIVYFSGLSGSHELRQMILLFSVALAILLLMARADRYHLKQIAVAVLVARALLGAMDGTFPARVEKVVPLDTAWLDMCQYVARSLPADACLVIPPHKFDFEYRTRRAAFVNGYSLSREADRVLEWLKRMKMIRALPRQDRSRPMKEYNPHQPGDYAKLTSGELLAIRQRYPFVKYCIMPRPARMPALAQIYANQGYTLYRIERSTSAGSGPP